MIKTSYYHHSMFIYTSLDYTFEIFMQVLFKMLTVLRFRPLLNTASPFIHTLVQRILTKLLLKKTKYTVHGSFLFPLSLIQNCSLWQSLPTPSTNITKQHPHLFQGIQHEFQKTFRTQRSHSYLQNIQHAIMCLVTFYSCLLQHRSLLNDPRRHLANRPPRGRTVSPLILYSCDCSWPMSCSFY